MAEIKLTALHHNHGGPDMPTPHYASIRERRLVGRSTVNVLVLQIGGDSVEIWPADPDHIEKLGKNLITIANMLREPCKS